MIEIQCTSCHTRYRIDERVLPDETPTFKCSRCGHVFNAEPAASREGKPPRAAVRPISKRAAPREEQKASPDQRASDPHPAAAQPAPAAEPALPEPPSDESPSEPRANTEELFNRSFERADDLESKGENLTFDFSDEDRTGAAAEPEAHDPQIEVSEPEWQVGEPEAESPPARAPREEPAYVNPRRPEPRFRVDDEPDPEEPPPPARDYGAGAKQFASGAIAVARSLSAGHGSLPDDAAYAASRVRAHSAGLILVMFFAVAVFFAAASTVICGTPLASARSLSEFPLIGSYFARPIVPAMLVALRGVRSNYQQIKSGEHALVITGTAENVGGAPLHAILLSIDLLDGAHRTVAAQAAYVGDGLSPKMIGEMTPREIEFLQRLNPQKSFAVQPNVSAPFAVVFLKPPQRVAHVRIEVSKASPEADAAKPRG